MITVPISNTLDQVPPEPKLTMSFIRNFFNFRKPIVSRLEYIDIVIQDKMLLLLSWEFPRRFWLRVSAPHKRYFSISGSVVLKIPKATTRIHVTVSNWWKKVHYTVELKKLSLDAITAKWLIHQLNPMQMPTSMIKAIDPDNLKPEICNFFFQSTTPLPCYKDCGALSTPELTFQLHSRKLVYPN